MPGPFDIYTVPGLVWVMTLFYYPLVFLDLQRRLGITVIYVTHDQAERYL